MTEVNEKFIEAMQIEVDKKKDEFIDDLNYKNMSIRVLFNRLGEQFNYSVKYASFIDAGGTDFRSIIRKHLVHLANFCWMLWERLGEEK